MNVSFERRDIAPAVESLIDNSRVIQIAGALGNTCLNELERIRTSGAGDNRRERALAVLHEEVPELFDALDALAVELNRDRTSTLRATADLVSPVLFRRGATHPHIDFYEFDASSHPFAYGPLSVSFGVSGSAVFRDFGSISTETIEVDRLSDPSYIKAIAGLLSYLSDTVDDIGYQDVPQSAGDIIIVPSIPFAHLHELRSPSNDRCAVVSGQLWVDTRQFDLGSVDDMARLRTLAHYRIRGFTPTLDTEPKAE